jgi:hypothetical protein
VRAVSSYAGFVLKGALCSDVGPGKLFVFFEERRMRPDCAFHGYGATCDSNSNHGLQQQVT